MVIFENHSRDLFSGFSVSDELTSSHRLDFSLESQKGGGSGSGVIWKGQSRDVKEKKTPWTK